MHYSVLFLPHACLPRSNGPSAVTVNTTLFTKQPSLFHTRILNLKTFCHRRQCIMGTQGDDRPTKRRKYNHSLPEEALAPTEHSIQDSPQKGLDRAISPPLSKRKIRIAPDSVIAPTWNFDNVPKEVHAPAPQPKAQQNVTTERASVGDNCTKYVSSPFQLTHIQDLASHQNVDAVGLKDLLGNPMIKECWNFNFLFDIDFVM